MVIVNYRNKKISQVYFNEYKKVEILEISKYDLNYTRYYTVIAIKELIIIFKPLNDLKWRKFSTTKFYISSFPTI